MKSVVIVGAAQHAKVVLHILRTSKSGKNCNIVGFVDDNANLHGKKIDGTKVLGKFDDLPALKKKLKIDHGIIGISNRYMSVRALYFKKLAKFGLDYVNAIHDSAVIESNTKIGRGVVINPNCVINSYASVGDNCVIYSNSVIEHEDVIGNNVYIGPGVILTADVRIGDNSFLGVGTKVIPHIKIGKNVIVGAGSVVTKNIGDNYVVVGVPAKILRKNRTKPI